MLEPGILIIVLFILYIFFFISQLKKKTSIFNHIVYFVSYLYINVVIVITLFPIPIQKELINDMVKEDYIKNSFIPLKDIISIIKNEPLSITLKQLMGNVLMFAPLGFFVPIIFRKISTFKEVLIMGFLSSVLIESLQAFISLIIGVRYKITSVDDVILNTIGAIIGFVMFKVAYPIINDYFIKDKEKILNS